MGEVNNKNQSLHMSEYNNFEFDGEKNLERIFYAPSPLITQSNVIDYLQ